MIEHSVKFKLTEEETGRLNQYLESGDGAVKHKLVRNAIILYLDVQQNRKKIIDLENDNLP
ncbi:MAG: hypothetical protein JXB88_03155 [Spirochaetales bacterium]|nr:hypothetical protein [Spirochaetales bacterium]